MTRAVDRRGQQYGLLHVVEQLESTAAGAAMWLCLCDCGKQVAVRGGNLASGKSTSCTRGPRGCEARQGERSNAQ